MFPRAVHTCQPGTAISCRCRLETGGDSHDFPFAKASLLHRKVLGITARFFSSRTASSFYFLVGFKAGKFTPSRIYMQTHTNNKDVCSSRISVANIR